MRLALALGVAVSVVTPLWGQQPASASSNERIRVALQNPPALAAGVPLTDAVHRTLGILTLIPPQYPGELIRVSLPIGELVARGVRGLRAAKYARAERNAREAVQRALSDFEATAAQGTQASRPLNPRRPAP